ncbi:SDR family oxidoreductase [Mesorhizobium sp. M0012]|uniref:SDR family NAD(P)-dependent oxidoreductase n=1 Tax=Mesorhizobium sp. M0012 TaxID=2956840 RepID=UPI0033367BFA
MFCLESGDSRIHSSGCGRSWARGIRCNAIAPGWINSDLSELYIDSMADSSRVRRELLAMHPVGRLGEPTDVGNLAVWLASAENAFVTGQVYVIDGGRTKKLQLPIP